jgi:probable F420-dependent oxidoreductase
MVDRIKLGTALPFTDIGADPGTVAAFAQAAEALGYDHLTGTDHVLGVNVENRPDWDMSRNTSADVFHDPFVLFGFLSSVTQRIEFSVQVLILAQRQTALVAKQAASLDVLCGGRFRLGVGIGWNKEEFIALNENFHDRGKRSEEQIEVMKRLWAEPHVTFKGKWHEIPDAGINPLPLNRAMPLWFGGHVDATLRRTAKYGDGWIMLAHPPGDAAVASFEKLRGYVAEEGRDPASVGIEIWTSAAEGGPEDWRAEARFWKDAGVTHITVNNARARAHHKRIEGRSFSDHLAGIERYREAVKDVL